MPPLRTAPKSYVYAITRRDFDYHTDRKGSLALIEIHGSLASADTAAKAHFNAQKSKAPFWCRDGAEVEEIETKDGRYDGYCFIREDRRDNFRVEVKKMELKGGKLTDAGATPL